MIRIHIVGTPFSASRRGPAGLLAVLIALLTLALPSTATAQTGIDQQKQDELETVHSVLQKSGLATLALTGVSGATLMANKPTLFGKGRCRTGDPLLGGFGCNELSYVHMGFAVATAGLFVASEIVAEEMPISPYEMGSPGQQDTMRSLRWTNVGLFIAQPILGLIAANPWLVGVPKTAREDFSAVLRTVHFGVGLGLATTYTVNAALQW